LHHNQNKQIMIKETDIRKSELSRKLLKINDRLQELTGEKITIFFQVEHKAINKVLAYLKCEAIDFEVMLLLEETKEIEQEHNFLKMLGECGLELEREDF
jgi:hypothetical protein